MMKTGSDSARLNPQKKIHWDPNFNEPYEIARRRGDTILQMFAKRQFNTLFIPQNLNVPKFQNRQIFYDNLLEVYKLTIDSIGRNIHAPVSETDTAFTSLVWFSKIDKQIRKLRVDPGEKSY